MIANSNTAAATSPKKIRWSPDDYRMGFVCKLQGAPVTGTALSATVAQLCQFSLTEATASTHAGSVITGATMTLGCATAYKPRSTDAMVLVITSAIGNWTDTGIVLIYPDDGQGTGLSCTAANATDFKTRPLSYTGCIELKAESLSTNYPKWIGVTLSTMTNASAERIVDCVRIPSYKPGWSGKSTVI